MIRFIYYMCQHSRLFRKAVFGALGVWRALRNGYRQPAPRSCVSVPVKRPHCMTLTDASVCGHGVVITADNRVLKTASPILFPPDNWHCLNAAWRIPAAQRMDGRIVALSANSEHGNYYHWMIDAFARLAVVPKFEQAKYLIEHDRKWQREYLEIAGINPADCIQPDNNIHLKPDYLIVPLMSENPCVITKEAIAFFRSLRDKVATPCAAWRKVYLTRGFGNSRSVQNEMELRQNLTSQGFEIVDMGALPCVADQMRIMYEAAIVMAPHGAAMTNIVFCRPGTKIIELCSPRYKNKCFEEICTMADLNYVPVECQRARKLNILPMEDMIVAPHRLLTQSIEKTTP